MLRLLSSIALCVLVAPSAGAYELLRNDDFAPGDGVAFYTRIGFEESFAAIYEVPDDHPVYRVCRVIPFVGPDTFNIYSLRLGVAGPDGGELGAGENLIWQSDQDAYQVFGSANQLGSIDLRGEDIVSDTRRLRVQMRVAGNERSPNIATDGDGITPERNYIRVLLRNGQSFRGFTEGMDPEGSPPRPTGDWILRTEIVRVDEVCPDPGELPPDAGPDEVFDMDLPRDDMGVEPDVGPVDLDMRVADMAPDPEPDMAPDPEPDMALEPDPDRGLPEEDAAVIQPDTGPMPDRGPIAGDTPLELDRIVPDRGSAAMNTEVLINGRGFLDGGGITRAELGPTRLLEPTALSGSTLTALVPAGIGPGVWDLRLIRGDGQVAVLPEAFTVAGEGPPPLTLRAVDPESIPAGSGAEVTILGGGFTGETEFSIGGAPLEDVVLDDAGQMARGTLVVPLAAGLYDVVARRGEEVVRLLSAVEVTAGRRPVDDGCRAAPGQGSGGGSGGVLGLLLLGLLAGRRR